MSLVVLVRADHGEVERVRDLAVVAGRRVSQHRYNAKGSTGGAPAPIGGAADPAAPTVTTRTRRRETRSRHHFGQRDLNWRCTMMWYVTMTNVFLEKFVGPL